LFLIFTLKPDNLLEPNTEKNFQQHFNLLGQIEKRSLPDIPSTIIILEIHFKFQANQTSYHNDIMQVNKSKTEGNIIV
jgi:hypothetical protein